MSPRRELRRLARTAWLGVCTAGMLPAYLARRSLASPGERERLQGRWVGAWCASLLEVFGIRVVVRGSVPPPGRGYLVVSNHRSTADILVLLRAFGGAVVARADIARWPLLGPAARAAGTLFVDRSDGVSGAAAVRAICTRLEQSGTVIVFPEGTTFPDDDVRPFRAGAFAAALRAGTAVVPVGLAYATGSGAAFVGESFPAHLARMAAAAPSAVAMCIGAAIETDTSARAGRIRETAQAEVQRLVHDARALVDAKPHGSR